MRNANIWFQQSLWSFQRKPKFKEISMRTNILIFCSLRSENETYISEPGNPKSTFTLLPYFRLKTRQTDAWSCLLVSARLIKSGHSKYSKISSLQSLFIVIRLEKFGEFSISSAASLRFFSFQVIFYQFEKYPLYLKI